MRCSALGLSAGGHHGSRHRPAARLCAVCCLDTLPAALFPLSPVLKPDEKPGIVYCDMDFSQLAERRANMPLRAQKRADLYALLDLTR